MKRALLACVLVVAGCGIQPSDPIPGSPGTGALIYLVRTYDNTVVPLISPTKRETPIQEALTILAETQNPEGIGYRNDVPRNAEPMTINGSTVTLPIDVTTLSTLAAEQIVCTAALPGPVTLVGGGQSRAPLECPVS